MNYLILGAIALALLANASFPRIGLRKRKAIAAQRKADAEAGEPWGLPFDPVPVLRKALPPTTVDFAWRIARVDDSSGYPVLEVQLVGSVGFDKRVSTRVRCAWHRDDKPHAELERALTDSISEWVRAATRELNACVPPERPDSVVLMKWN